MHVKSFIQQLIFTQFLDCFTISKIAMINNWPSLKCKRARLEDDKNFVKRKLQGNASFNFDNFFLIIWKYFFLINSSHLTWRIIILQKCKIRKSSKHVNSNLVTKLLNILKWHYALLWANIYIRVVKVGRSLVEDYLKITISYTNYQTKISIPMSIND